MLEIVLKVFETLSTAVGLIIVFHLIMRADITAE